MQVKAQIEEKLQKSFLPHILEVIDESDHHKGHGGWREGGNTHFRIKMVGGQFKGTTPIAKHREIHTILAAELAGGVHALAIELA